MSKSNQNKRITQNNCVKIQNKMMPTGCDTLKPNRNDGIRMSNHANCLNAQNRQMQTIQKSDCHLTNSFKIMLV